MLIVDYACLTNQCYYAQNYAAWLISNYIIWPAMASCECLYSESSVSTATSAAANKLGYQASKI